MEKIALQEYPIFLGKCSQALKAFLMEKQYASLFVLVDEHTKALCLPLVQGIAALEQATIIEIPAGEQHKNLDTCQTIWHALIDAGAERNSLLINLGGGVIGDMGGFCAATFKRGMPFVQIPTTLLSQVDASIGGKLGIDFEQVKNSIGVFANPQAVFIDPEFLHTLSRRELRSGFAEVIKHALIADAEQWEGIRALTSLEDEAVCAPLIRPSLEIKRRIVEADPFERGLRKALNFGHTIGHALEGLSLSREHPLLHGEAIAAGMACEAYLSWKAGFLDPAARDDIAHFLLTHYQTPQFGEEDFDTYLSLMRNDKKNEGGKINFSLIGPAGTVHINQYAEGDAIAESLRWLNAFSRGELQ